MVSVHCWKTPRVVLDHGGVFAAQPFGRKLDRRERVLDLVRDAARHVGPGRGALRGHELGDVVERHDVAVLGRARLLAGHADRQIALAAVAVDRHLALHQPLHADARGREHVGELGHDLGERPSERLGLGSADQPLGRPVQDADAALARRRR